MYGYGTPTAGSIHRPMESRITTDRLSEGAVTVLHKNMSGKGQHHKLSENAHTVPLTVST